MGVFDIVVGVVYMLNLIKPEFIKVYSINQVGLPLKCVFCYLLLRPYSQILRLNREILNKQKCFLFGRPWTLSINLYYILCLQSSQTVVNMVGGSILATRYKYFPRFCLRARKLNRLNPAVNLQTHGASNNKVGTTLKIKTYRRLYSQKFLINNGQTLRWLLTRGKELDLLVFCPVMAWHANLIGPIVT